MKLRGIFTIIVNEIDGITEIQVHSLTNDPTTNQLFQMIEKYVEEIMQKAKAWKMEAVTNEG